MFGGFGAIGAAVAEGFRNDGTEVIVTSRHEDSSREALRIDLDEPETLTALDSLPPLDAVVWAQGVSCNDTAATWDEAIFDGVMKANCVWVVKTLNELLRRDLLAPGARMCVVSSIWQEQSRPGRLSYSISKAALGGLVRSAAVDLAYRGMLVNAVLPGVVDGPMAQRPNSSANAFASWTAHKRIIPAQDVAEVVVFLCGERNRSLTGQSIAVDLGVLTSVVERS